MWKYKAFEYTRLLDSQVSNYTAWFHSQCKNSQIDKSYKWNALIVNKLSDFHDMLLNTKLIDHVQQSASNEGREN